MSCRQIQDTWLARRVGAVLPAVTARRPGRYVGRTAVAPYVDPVRRAPDAATIPPRTCWSDRPAWSWSWSSSSSWCHARPGLADRPGDVLQRRGVRRDVPGAPRGVPAQRHDLPGGGAADPGAGAARGAGPRAGRARSSSRSGSPPRSTPTWSAACRPSWSSSCSGFGVPALRLQGVPTSPVFWGTVALVVSYGAYVAEVFRAGIGSVHPSQRAAARSLGLSSLQTTRYVMLPQAVRTVVPPLLNDFISLQKDTALVVGAGARSRCCGRRRSTARTRSTTPPTSGPR